MKPADLDAELQTLLAPVRGVPLTEIEIDAQVRSFAFGNLVIEHPETKRETIDRVAIAERSRVVRG